MIIYLRHGEDNYDNPTFAHDQKIPQVEEIHDDIEKVGKFLITKYGQPSHIICSPFRRARDTYNILKRKNVLPQESKLLIDTRVGRYFSSKEKKDGPEVRKETKKMKPSIYESWESFKVRVRNHVNQLKDDGFLKSRHNIVWVITHTLVIKEVARYLHFEMPEYYEFLQWVALRSHGPEHKISFIAMGDGAKDPEVLQEDIRRKKGVKREKIEKEVKKNEESDSGFEDDHSGYDDSGNLVLIKEGGTRKIEKPVKEEKLVEKRKYRKPKEEKVVEKKEKRPGPPQPKPKEEEKKKIVIARIATLDDHINLNVKRREAELQKKKEERGKPLDEQVKEHFKSIQTVVVKDKYESARGGNLDDFIKAYEGGKSARM